MIKLFSVLFHPTPTNYEDWLEELSQKGWFPKNINNWSSLFFIFEKKIPENYRYVLDLQTNIDSDYIQIYEEFGWEFCGRLNL